jgi:hypothetical protein
MAGKKILYLVHDVSDPAVAKRVAMLESGGATVTLAGFRRNDRPIQSVIDLGRTYNGRFAQRILAVIREMVFLRQHAAAFQGADAIVARNLEMLAIAVRGRALCNPKPVLVYESLDIHRLLLNSGPISKAFRGLEGWLSRKASLLITSSPAFVSGYFEAISQVYLPTRLVENKVFAPGGIVRDVSPRKAGPPWRIGWFGAIRCATSLKILCDLTRDSHGAIEVIIRGRPAYDQLPDFDEKIQTPGIIFQGPYKNPDDLEKIYRNVHFTWAIDRFEARGNSSWLLPNRIYEGGIYASVPIAEKAVETGRFLDRLNIGVTLNDPVEKSLSAFFATLTADRYGALEQAAAAVPITTWVYDQKDCIDLVAALAR